MVNKKKYLDIFGEINVYRYNICQKKPKFDLSYDSSLLHTLTLLPNPLKPQNYTSPKNHSTSLARIWYKI